MKQFFKMFFASLLAMVVAGVIVFAVLIGLAITAVKSSVSTDKEVTVANNSILKIDLGNGLQEQGESNSLAMFDDGSSYKAGLYDALHAIKYAKDDKNIKGIYLKLSPTSNGWATLQQLRTALLDFKHSNKFVYAYGENISQGSYYVASAADSVFLNPMGDIELKGFATTLMFFKGMLDKLEIQPEIFYAGKFKSATEPFRADKMSEPNREQIKVFQAGFWREFIQAVAQHTKADTATVNSWAVTGAIQFPADALNYKLVDGLTYWDEVEARMRAKTDTKEKDKLKYITLDEYASDVKRKNKSSDKRIAILIAEGSIVDGENEDNNSIASETFIEHIRKVRDNDKIKAVVMRVNSPGGSALASEVILRELSLLRKKKPLVVSMGDVAASGGYYIACEADSIFALPNTITGSIGVFGMLFNVENMMKNKLGITFDEVKNAPYADFPTAARPLTPDEATRMQRMIDHIYTTFKTRVANGRKIPVGDVDSIAQGRVWTGTDALRIKLVDGLGDLDRAVASAAKLSKVSDYQVVTYPEPTDKFDNVMRMLSGGATATASTIIKSSLEKELGKDYAWFQQVKELSTMSGKALMAMPFRVNIK